jgi:hypothetical protein
MFAPTFITSAETVLTEANGVVSEVQWPIFKLHGLSPLGNYIDRATAACRRSNCQLVRTEGTTWSA